MTAVAPGRFIVFEGGEGSGKSTQARLLAERIGGRFTFEPGDSDLGVELRRILLDPATGNLDPRAEALLMAADRAHHVATVVRPLIAAGVDVVCDRYIGSTVAYQGFGRGLDVPELLTISEFAADGLYPDITLYLDVPASVSAGRLAATKPDRLEAAGDKFHRRVAEGFRAQADGAHTAGHRWVRVDGTGTIEQVAARIDTAIEQAAGPVTAADVPSRVAARIAELAGYVAAPTRTKSMIPVLEEAAQITGVTPGLTVNEALILEARWIIERPDREPLVINVTFGPELVDIYGYDRAIRQTVYEGCTRIDNPALGREVGEAVQRLQQRDR